MALLCRPGAPSRAREPGLVREALTGHLDQLVELPDGATLDGGDVLRLDSRLYSCLYVGRSRRTSPAGIDALARLAAPRTVVPVAVPAGFLHLQTAVTALGPGALIGVPEALALFEPPVRGVPVAPEEHPAASVLTIGRHVIMAAGCPKAAARVRELGYEVHESDLSEFTKADGGPTCLSLRI
jgi:dimethylargininase